MSLRQALVIFGASGDLAAKKIFPALFSIEKKGLLGDDIEIIGASRREWEKKAFSEHVAKQLDGHQDQDNAWKRLKNKLDFVQVEFTNQDHYRDLKKYLEEKKYQRVVFYYSVAPEFFEQITEQIRATRILEALEDYSVVVEKPFGHDLTSAIALHELFTSVFAEKEIYRIDHVLNKTALQDIIDFRKHNFALSQLLCAEKVDHIQVNYSEDIGIGNRGNFYEKTGAIRDMVQSHILEALGVLMADIPEDYSASSLQESRKELIGSFSFESNGSKAKKIITGQYEGYTQEENVATDSNVETFVALRLKSNHKKWKNTPIYIKTGKKLNKKYFDLHVVFKYDPKNVFTFRISPNSGINLRLWKDENVDLSYCYKSEKISDAYENLLNSVLVDKKLMFVSQEEVEASWALIDSIRNQLKQSGQDPILYEPGSKGPAEADEIMEHGGWLDETISDFCKI
ncbi:MAG: glucose-6-phosphate dehydrogenase [Candidatus Dojkabacteria bacterium]